MQQLAKIQDHLDSHVVAASTPLAAAGEVSASRVQNNESRVRGWWWGRTNDLSEMNGNSQSRRVKIWAKLI
jgi:hypothetical protein